MSNLLVLSPNDCQNKTWQPPTNLAFAANRELIPLHAGELLKAAASMPLALAKNGHDWELVGVCGQQTGHNLFIKEGEWLGNYTPEWLACYPFDIYMVGDNGLITFDRNSGLESDGGIGKPFFDAEGGMTKEVVCRVEVLKKAQGRRLATQSAVTALVQAGVVTPWPEQLISQFGITISGLHMIDEQKLAALEEPAFLALRQALPVAYALNFSVSQAHLLTRLSRINSGQITTPVDLDKMFGEDDDTLSFGF